MASTKSKTVSVGGKTHIVKVGSKADTKYSSMAGAVSSSNPTQVRAAQDASKARTSAASSGIPPNAPESFSASNMGTTAVTIPPGGTPTIGASGASLMGGTPVGYTQGPDGMLVANEPQTDATTSTEDFITKYFPKKESIFKNPQYLKEQANVERARAEENRLSGQITSIVNQAQASALQTTGQGRGIPEEIIGGQQAQIYKEAAIQALPLQAQLAIAQGNTEAAQAHLDNFTKILTEEVNNEYQWRSQVLTAFREEATAAQKRKLDEIDRKNERFAEAKTSALTNASQRQAPASVTNAIRAAKTEEEVITAAGKWGQSALDAASLYTESLQQQKLLAELNPDPTVSNDDLSAYASQYADTGKLPSPAELKLAGLSVGQVTQMAKQMPKPTGALVSNKTGTKSPSISAAQEDGLLALYDITKKTAQLKELDEKRAKGLTSAALGKVFGFKDQENYLALRQEIIDLLSRARTGAALTASEEAFYKGQLPGRIGEAGPLGIFGADTQNRINNFETKITGTLDTRLNGYDASIYGHSKVNVGGTPRVVGEILDIDGVQYKVLPDGTLTDII